MSGYNPLRHDSGWAMLALTVVSVLVTVLVNVVSMKYTNAAEIPKRGFGPMGQLPARRLIAGLERQSAESTRSLDLYDSFPGDRRRKCADYAEKRARKGHSSTSAKSLHLYGVLSNTPITRHEKPKMNQTHETNQCKMHKTHITSGHAQIPTMPQGFHHLFYKPDLQTPWVSTIFLSPPLKYPRSEHKTRPVSLWKRRCKPGE